MFDTGLLGAPPGPGRGAVHLEVSASYVGVQVWHAGDPNRAEGASVAVARGVTPSRGVRAAVLSEVSGSQ